MNTPDPLLPFGKHKGAHASECPVEYLDWLIGQDWMLKGWKRQIAEEITQHLQTRADWQRMETDE